MEGWGGARVASVAGRYYAMDRDKRWDRTELALAALVDGEAEFSAESGEAAVRQAYDRGETDEFIKPTLVGEEGRIRAGDSVIFFNFRPDRARQLTRRWTSGSTSGSPRSPSTTRTGAIPSPFPRAA